MVVDGHPVFAEALALAIDATDELDCVGTARDADEALAAVDGPTCVMDVDSDR